MGRRKVKGLRTTPCELYWNFSRANEIAIELICHMSNIVLASPLSPCSPHNRTGKHFQEVVLASTMEPT